MSIDANKAVVRRFFEEILGERRLDLLGEVVADDFVLHTPVPDLGGGAAAARRWLEIFLVAFPQERTEIHTMIAEADLVAVYHSHRATHTGEFMGMPPTGRAVDVQGVEIYRVAGGRIAEAWHHDDMLALFTQLGMIPAPAAA